MQKKYYNRELSWLSFNSLVLEQVKDKSLPIYERARFLAIYSSNIDEFYRVRIASYRSLAGIPQKNRKSLDYLPEEILDEIRKIISKNQKEYENLFYNEIIPQFKESGIILYHNQELEDEHNAFLKDYFLKEVLPEIQPVLLSRSGNVLSFLQDNKIYLAIKMFKRKKTDDRPYYAVIKIPPVLPRFVELPNLQDYYLIMFIEDVIRMNLQILFPGYNIENSYSIKVSRDADLFIEDEFSGNILNKLRKSLKQRKTGNPARFKYDRTMPADFLEVIKLAFNLSERDFVEGGRYLNFNDFFTFPNPFSPKYELPNLKPLLHPTFEKYKSILKAVKNNDIMLHFPYHTYDYVLRFFNEAALNPDVKEIKTTQYRVATNSSIVNALITAARNGKKVTVFVELKARFDEETNLRFADQMKSAGINVITGIPDIKVHAKAALVVKKSKSDKSGKKGYAFVSTGNFNEKTAKQYSDKGLFTSDKRIIKDLEKLFTYLETRVEKINFKNILVPRFNFLQELKSKILREIENAKKGEEAHIILKVNGLEEREVIDLLYEASQNNVKVDLIVRGICCLRPGMSFSKNIKVIRIVDRFLEHARIFVFHNSGEKEIFISSADLMERNIHRRVETIVPIFDNKIKKEIFEIIKIQLKDNTKAKILDKDIQNCKIKVEGDELYRAQVDTYLYLQKKALMESV